MYDSTLLHYTVNYSINIMTITVVTIKLQHNIGGVTALSRHSGVEV